MYAVDLIKLHFAVVSVLQSVSDILHLQSDVWRAGNMGQTFGDRNIQNIDSTARSKAAFTLKIRRDKLKTLGQWLELNL